MLLERHSIRACPRLGAALGWIAFGAGLALAAEAQVQIVPAREKAPSVQNRAPGQERESVRAASAVQGPVYTWEDGDRTLRVRLQPDLRVREEGELGEREFFVVRAGDHVIVRSESRAGASEAAGDDAAADDAAAADGQPVFRSESGTLMTLPGGVVLIFDRSLSDADRAAFFAANGIDSDRASPLGAIPGAFLVETEPGFPSLDLANALAGQPGVEVSSPNWWKEAFPR